MTSRRLPTNIRWRAVGFLTAGAAAALPAVQLLMFRRWGGRLVPGPHDLNGTVGRGRAAMPSARWVWLGDSLSSGIGALSADESFPWQTASLIAESTGRDVALTCLAVPGATAADVLVAQVPVAVCVLEVGMVAIVAVGCNDVLRLVRPAAFRATYTTIVASLSSTRARVVLVGLPDLASMMVAMRQPLRSLIAIAGRRADAEIRRIAVDAKVNYVAINIPLMRSAARGSVLSADRWHPNGEGYRMWAKLVAAHLES
jgi:lysophospholipase L1-like esterase